MIIKKNLILLYPSVIIAALTSIFFWDKIVIPYKNPEITGIYSLNSYNGFNDFLRYINFILLPAITFLLVKCSLDKDFFKKINSFFSNDPKIENNFVQSRLSYLILLFFLIFFLFEFFSVNFPDHKIDTFHDGQRLSSAYKNLIDGSLWSGSFVTVGIFYETISSRIIWSLVDHVSIGLVRYVELIYILVLKILLIFTIFNLLSLTGLNKFYKNIFFIFNAISINYLTDYNLNSVDLLTFREVPVIFLVLLFILMLKHNNNLIILFLISLTSLFSVLWGIDRGLVCNVLIIFIFFYIILIKDYKKTFYLFSFLIVVWLTFFLIQKNEFYYFFDNTISIYKNMSYVHGIIHPVPFSSDPNAGRATKTLIIILFLLIFSLRTIFENTIIHNSKLKKLLLFLSFICVLSYIYALGRSDGAHIKHTFGFPILTLSILVYYYFCKFFQKKKIIFFEPSLVIGTIFYIMFFNSIKLNNIDNYINKLNKFIYKEDEFFLNKEESEFIKQIKPIVNSYDCIQLFTNDAAFNYLLRKKSCTKYYFVWSASPKKIQKEFINELSNTNFIIKGGTKSNWEIPLEKKLNLVNDYISLNFKKKIKITQWTVFLRN
tara:strand:+ start:3218 stop:5023 length:1806 start_codon:yes stop_codon:yes gene_type:complete